MDIPRSPRRRWPKKLAWALAAVVVAAGGTCGLSRLRAALPSVDGSTVWVDTVKRGTMLRQVQGQGRLVPEEVRWISAPADARVDKIIVQPGAEVAADSVLVTLINPD